MARRMNRPATPRTPATITFTHPHTLERCLEGSRPKRCYATRKDARRSMRDHRGWRERLHVYSCQCGGFHLGHNQLQRLGLERSAAYG